MTYVMTPPLSCSRDSMVMDTAVYAITTALRNGVIFASCTPAQTDTPELASRSTVWLHAYCCLSNLHFSHAALPLTSTKLQHQHPSCDMPSSLLVMNALC